MGTLILIALVVIFATAHTPQEWGDIINNIEE